MGLAAIVRSAVATAKAVTADLQPTVVHHVYRSADGAGASDYDDVARPALVTRKQKYVRSASGELVASVAEVVFLDPGVVVHEHDRITLPDGTGGSIVATDGFVDRGTGHPFLTQVWIG